MTYRRSRKKVGGTNGRTNQSQGSGTNIVICLFFRFCFRLRQCSYYIYYQIDRVIRECSVLLTPSVSIFTRSYHSIPGLQHTQTRTPSLVKISLENQPPPVQRDRKLSAKTNAAETHGTNELHIEFEQNSWRYMFACFSWDNDVDDINISTYIHELYLTML